MKHLPAFVPFIIEEALGMSNTTAFTVWVVTCVGIGLAIAAADGIGWRGIVLTALLISVIMIVGLTITAALRKWSSKR